MSTETYQISRLEFNNYPVGQTFVPHGLDIYKDKIYVINHDHDTPSERIDVFKVVTDNSNTPISLDFIQSL